MLPLLKPISSDSAANQRFFMFMLFEHFKFVCKPQQAPDPTGCILDFHIQKTCGLFSFYWKNMTDKR